MDIKKPSTLLLVFFGILIFGTSGYHFIEGWSWLDSLFMTVISITTVGYREVGGELSDAGKVFTIVLLIGGLGVAATVFSRFALLFFRGELQVLLGRRKMKSEIDRMKDHYIVAGYGRTGQVIVSHLALKKIPFLIIDEAEQVVSHFKESGIPHILGDASDEKVLLDAGIARAKGFIAVVSSDATNSFAIMTARELNPKLHIIARAMDSRSVKKLKMAGANKVIAPYVLGGLRIAQAISNPHAADLIDIIEDVQAKHIEMADLNITSKSAIKGAKLSDDRIRQVGVIVIGIRKPDGQFVFQPNANTELAEDDHLILIGPGQNIEKMYSLI